jgi:cytochrome c oxidase assembly protein subunit 15
MRAQANNAPSSKAVRLWLLAVAGLILLTVLVGGATRLTESGLSIVEWRPVTGTLPPLSPTQWSDEFEKYKAIPQFKVQNSAMTLSDFKTIYWWEWGHRLLGRLIGVVFLLPFLFFLWKGWIAPRLRTRLWIIFALGGLQGAVGWWMVASGLTERTSVSQYRLAFHLTLACVIYAAVVATARELTARAAGVPLRWSASSIAILALVLVQIYLGALVAGLDAGLTYNTWPRMDGALVPSASQLFVQEPAWRNLFENPLTVQFNHRMAAYVLCAAVLLQTLHAWLSPRAAGLRMIAFALAVAVAMQAVIGVLTLLHGVPIALGLLHQAGAMLVLTLAVVAAVSPLGAGAEHPGAVDAIATV